MTMPGKMAAAYCLLVKGKSLRDTAGLRGWLNDLMIELFKTHADAIGFYPQRADGVVGRVELVLFAHEGLQLLLTPEDPERPGAP